MTENKFGSVAWQNELRDSIALKVLSGKELDDFEKTFVTIQVEHNYKEVK